MKPFIFIILTTLTLIGCKRVCQDERATNYKDGSRKDECRFAYADNWAEGTIIDCVLVNGVNLDFPRTGNGYFYGYTPYSSMTEPGYEHKAAKGGRNQTTLELYEDDFWPDTLKSIEYTFGIPVASNFPFTISNQNHYVNARINDISEEIVNGEDDFVFLEERTISGVKYYFYNVNIIGIDDAFIITRENIYSCRVRIGINNDDVFGVGYEIAIYPRW